MQSYPLKRCARVKHGLVILWCPEVTFHITRWFQIGALWVFVALYGSFGVVSSEDEPLFSHVPRGRSLVFVSER